MMIRREERGRGGVYQERCRLMGFAEGSSIDSVGETSLSTRDHEGEREVRQRECGVVEVEGKRTGRDDESSC